MLKSRLGKIFAFILALFILLEIRIFYLQAIRGKSLFEAASAQREVSVPVEKDRGEILDRNGIQFTDNTRKILAVLQPSVLRGREADIKKICDTLNLDNNRLESEINASKEPILDEIDENTKDRLLGLKLEGVSVIYTLKRYGDKSIAKHVTGYLGATDNVGEAGIEKSFEDILRINGESNISAIADARSNLIKGLGYRVTDSGASGKKLNVKLTLDFHIQSIVEDAMEKNNITGAVVVEDVNNGDIVAMASKPDYNQNNVGKYLNSGNRELFNRAVASYNLGSIFKIIDVTLFYEQGMNPEDEFYCPGYIKVGSLEFKCSSYDKGGNGSLNLPQAFAQSCNSFFINLGLKLGYKNLIETAQKFGINEPTGIEKQGIDESPGKLPDLKKYYSQGDVANLAIGQGDVMATPLQVADMVATIANGGIKNQVNIVDSVVDQNGDTVKDLRIKKEQRVISGDIANKVMSLMEQVTENGTGTKASLIQYGGSGGKTGTAETGQVVKGQKVVHAWFAGYFPKNNPKYSIAVFVENGQSGGQVAAPIFEEIAEEISKKGL